MKTLTVVAAAMLALVARARAGPVGGKRPMATDKKAEQKKPQVDDKAYKAALERIPEPKEKYDPWGVRRPADTREE